MKEKTLLEKAKDVQLKRDTRSNFSDEDCELAIALIKNEVTPKQASVAWYGTDKKDIDVRYRIFTILKYCYENKKIKIIFNPNQ